jgi:hypothetical protein
MMRWFVVLCISACCVALSGCGDGGNEAAVRQEMEQRAQEFIGPADQYRVQVAGLTSDAVKSVHFTGYSVQAGPKLIIDSLTVTLADVRFQRAPFAVKGLGRSTFSGRISEASLNDAVRYQARAAGNQFSNFRITLRRDMVAVAASYTVYGVKIPVETTGMLHISDGIRVMYEPKTLKVGGIGVPNLVQGMLASAVNPLVDLSALRCVPHIDRVRSDTGALIVEGMARLPQIQPALNVSR